MNEEKSMIEYKERKGPFQWLKVQFEKLKEKFRPKTEVKREIDEGTGFTEEDLKVVKGGYPNPNILDFDEIREELSNLQEKRTWELTEEEKISVQEGFEEIKSRNSDQDKDELSQEELEIEDKGSR